LALKQSRWTLAGVSSPDKVVRSIQDATLNSHAACTEHQPTIEKTNVVEPKRKDILLFSALEVFHVMRYTNLRLLTYLLTYSLHKVNRA